MKESMKDYLVNEEESRIAAFGNSVQVKLNKESESAPIGKKAPEKNKKEHQQLPVLSEKEETPTAGSFLVRVDKDLEFPIHCAILDFYKKTGKKISICQFVSNILKTYLEE